MATENTTQAEERAAAYEIASADSFNDEQRERIMNGNGGADPYTPIFSATKQYQELDQLDKDNLSEKERNELVRRMFNVKNGGLFEQMRQTEIDKSLEMPISEVITNRDKYRARLDELTKTFDDFSEDKFEQAVERLVLVYETKGRGANDMANAQLKADFLRDKQRLYFEHITLPKNQILIDRYEAEVLYEVYEHRVELYVKSNEDKIREQIEAVKGEEIRENLLALAPYVEG